MGGRHESNAIDINEDEKKNPKSNKTVMVRKGKLDVCGRKKSQTFTK